MAAGPGCPKSSSTSAAAQRRTPLSSIRRWARHLLGVRGGGGGGGGEGRRRFGGWVGGGLVGTRCNSVGCRLGEGRELAVTQCVDV